jgi:hypothetical protein
LTGKSTGEETKLVTLTGAYLRRFFVLITLTLGALLSLPGRVSAGTNPAAAQAAIHTAYDQINAAFCKHDLDRFMSYFTPDYIDIDEKGEHLTKEQVRQGYRKQLGQIKTMQSHYAILSCTPATGGYLVEMKMHSDGTGEKRILFARLKGIFTNDIWVRDLWVNTPQGWRLQHRFTLQDQLNVHPR